MLQDTTIIAAGIYTPRQAARLVRATPQEVLRWTRGSGATEALWDAHYQFIDDTTEISFTDLIELRVVKALRRSGVSLQAIRFAIDLASRKFGVAHPLSTLKFKTDGKQILVDALEQDGDFLSLSKHNPGQKVFGVIVEQSLSDIEYEEGKSARWRPGETRTIVIDPQRAFGAPIIDKFGIQTDAIMREYSLSQDIGYLSKVYEIPQSCISDAIKFERSLDQDQIH